jgi:acyl-CoA synthetase (AMP-forming)/AMP-acid ligase II
MDILTLLSRPPTPVPWLEDARTGRRLRRDEVPRLAAAWAGHLDRLGVAPGTRVGLSGGDAFAMATAWFGILAAGRIVCPVATDLTPEQRARWQREIAPVTVLDAAAEPSGRLGKPMPGGGVVLMSSGTTGTPKVVALTAEQLLHTAANVVSAHRLTADDRAFNPLPLHHINGEVVGLLAPLLSGGTVVLDARFRRTGFWELLADRDVTWLNAVPAILAILTRSAAPDHVPPRLRFVRSASARLPEPVRRTFVETVGVPVVETYGMTEAGSQITANDVDDVRPGSVGRPVGVRLRIVVGGRVQIAGPSVVTSYAGAAGKDSFCPDGWLDTGDVGRLVDGHLYLDGRVDDVINRGGEKVFPHEVEDVLLADPAVTAAAVVGWPDDVLGEVPLAAVVVDGEPEAVLARLRERAEAALDRSRRPAGYRVVARLPEGVNGKVSRRAVRRLLLASETATVPVR